MRNLFSMMVVAVMLFTMPVTAQQKPKEKAKKECSTGAKKCTPAEMKACKKDKKTCTASEMKSCTKEKKAACCMGKAKS